MALCQKHRTLKPMNKYLILLAIAIPAIVVSSAIPIYGTDLWYNQYLSLLFFTFLGCSFLLWNFNRWLAILSGYLLINSFFVSRVNPRAIILLVQFNLSCMAAYGISRFNQSQRKKIVYAFLVAIVLQGALMVLQCLNLDPIFNSIYNAHQDNPVGFSASPDQVGSFFAVLAPILLFIHPALLLISLFGIICSKSSFAFVAALFGSALFYFGTAMKHKVLYALIAIAVLCTIFFANVDKLNSEDFKTRFNVWHAAVSSAASGLLIISTPITTHCNSFLGFGFGNFLSIFPKVSSDKFNYSDEKFVHAHNDFVELFFETGYIGALLLLELIVFVIIGFIKSKKSVELYAYFSALVAYILNAQGNFLTHTAANGMLLFLIYGLYEGARRDLNGQQATVV